MTLVSEDNVLYWYYMKKKNTYWVQSCTEDIKINYIWVSTKDTSKKITYLADISQMA